MPCPALCYSCEMFGDVCVIDRSLQPLSIFPVRIHRIKTGQAVRHLSTGQVVHFVGDASVTALYR